MKIPRSLVYGLFSLPWIAAMLTVAWVIVHRFPPNGIFTTTTTFETPSAFINPFLPAERTTSPGQQPEGWTGQRIIADPVYFTAHVPGPYERADVDIEFKPLRQPLLEFGTAHGDDLDLSPFYSEALEQPTWKTVPGGYVDSQVASLSNLNAGQLMTWDASATSLALADPINTTPPTEIQTSLRGAHDFYLVPAGGMIDIDFGIQDVRRDPGNSTAAFRIFYNDQEMKRDVLVTSGSRDTRMGPVIDHHIVLDHALPGVYRISLQADDDVFIRTIKTTSQYWVIGPRLSFGDVVGYATTTYPGRAWTNSRHVVAETLHVEGIQTVSLGPTQTRVIRTHESFRIDRNDGQIQPVQLLAPRGDIRLVGDGWFALQPDAFFEPKPKRLTDGTDVALEGIQGILTPYQHVRTLSDGWMDGHYSLALDPTQDTLRFVLSTPGIASRLGAIDIRRITIRYQRPAMSFSEWWHVLRQELANAWHRL